jgi:hypothetical protein
MGNVQIKTAAEIADEREQARLASMKCSRRAARLVLLEQGLLNAVEQRAADDPAFRIWYEDSATWHRTDPVLIEAWEAISGDTDQLEGLFAAAKEKDL